MRVFTPAVSEAGWTAGGHSVVEVVTDDMPFLVDSLTMELTRQLRDVHAVIHPQFDVIRDITGALQSVAPVADGSIEPPTDAIRESWMHIEIARVPDDEDTGAIEESLLNVLRDVRESVEDWEKMHGQVLAIVDELKADGLAAVRGGDRAGQRPAALAGRRPLHVPRLPRVPPRARRTTTRCCGRCPAPASASCAPTRTCRPRSASCPPLVKQKAREKTLLVLAKANSRATVHRPAFLDYVGVKKFDENGEVIGERRFLGLFSSAAYTESLTRIPLLREKAAEVLRRIGFDPRSHAGKALMDTLETYPRDELFHTPVDELAPIAEAVMHARERRQLRMFIRRDTYGRYVSVLVYLPRDRYNTNVRERFSAILKERLGGASVEFSARVTESTTANVHFVIHPPKGGVIAEVDMPDLERRLTEASRSWRDDFATAVMNEYGEESGAAPGPPVPRLVPRGLQGGLPPRHRLLRPRPARGARAPPPTSRASTCPSTRRWTPAAARPG